MNRDRSSRAGCCPLPMKAVSIEEAANGGALWIRLLGGAGSSRVVCSKVRRADLLGLRVGPHRDVPAPDLSRGPAGASQHQIADAADRVALPPAAREVANGIDARAVSADPETKAPHKLIRLRGLNRAIPVRFAL